MDAAYEAIAAGGVALVATDTVYGLAALPDSAGCARIYELKRRPCSRPLAQLVSSEGMLHDLAADVQPCAARLARMFWPGALTLVVAARGGGTLAVRCPDDARCRALVERLGRSVACTSANLHGEPTPPFKDALPESFRTLPGFAELPARCEGTASTVVDCTCAKPHILREGPISAHVIWDVSVFA